MGRKQSLKKNKSRAMLAQVKKRLGLFIETAKWLTAKCAELWARHNMPPSVKEKIIFISWVSGLVLAASLLWALSHPLRATSLMRSVNREMAQSGDARRIEAPIAGRAGRPAPMGFWYSLSGADSRFFVFMIMREGILVPAGAEIDSHGKIVDLIPLGSHARQVMGKIPQGVIKAYSNRIEASAIVAKGAL